MDGPPFAAHKTEIHEFYGEYKIHLANFPIGSRVTEATCNMLIKQRFCLVGIRRKQKGSTSILNLRALVFITQRWTQFWQKK